MNVLLCALELLSVEELGVRSIEDLDSVMPAEPMSELGPDNCSQRRSDRHNEDIDVVATALDPDTRSKEAGGDQQGVAR